jgi:drug/metabolite transporter (DMT)-like permease
MYRLGHQAIYAALGIAGVAVALVFEGRGEFDRADWGWWTAQAAGVLLALSWLTTRRWLKRRR